MQALVKEALKVVAQVHAWAASKRTIVIFWYYVETMAFPHMESTALMASKKLSPRVKRLCGLIESLRLPKYFVPELIILILN